MRHFLRGARGSVSGLLVAACFLVASPVFGQSGSIGNWKFDEGSGSTAADASGSGNSGTLVNSPTWTTGKSNSGLSFSTGTPLVSVNGSGNLANLRTTGLTVSAWIYRTASGRVRIVDKDNQSVGWFLGVTTAGKLTFWSDVYTTVGSRDSSAVLATGSWVHVAATWDGSTGTSTVPAIHLYINGVANESTTWTNATGSTFSDSTTPLTIGNMPIDTTFNFKGTLDEVRVYNRVLTSAEIQTLADATVPNPPTTVSASGVSSSRIDVTWSGATDNVAVTGYSVERCAGSSCTSGFTQVGTASASPFSNTGLPASTTYRYRVLARDANGNFSAPSAPSAPASTSAAGGGSDTSAPSIPTGLRVTASSDTEIHLTWDPSTDNVAVTLYLLDRCLDSSCTWAPIGTPAGTTFNDTGLTPQTTYRYRVRARDAALNTSDYSTVLVTNTAPKEPTCQTP